MQLASLGFEAVFDSPLRVVFLTCFALMEYHGKFVRLVDGMNQCIIISLLLDRSRVADDVVIFAKSSTKLQHVVNLASKLAVTCELRPDKCKKMSNGILGGRSADRARRRVLLSGLCVVYVMGVVYVCVWCVKRSSKKELRRTQRRRTVVPWCSGIAQYFCVHLAKVQ
ncbi:hypothetical protein RB195_005688 [Necator americanus]|uniref:Reverse transcriptase domain-containing protein n=1 Tax=Necator americanus TaxID=51031 RepID=A0ABR1BQL0_NECAM